MEGQTQGVGKQKGLRDAAPKVCNHIPRWLRWGVAPLRRPLSSPMQRYE